MVELLTILDRNISHYAIPAVVITLFCIVLPLLLLIYPCKFFQRFMNFFTFFLIFYKCLWPHSSAVTRMVLNLALEIVDAWFAAVDFLCRILFCLAYSFTLSTLFFPLASLMFFLLIFLIVNIQPYSLRVSHFLKIDLSIYCFLGMLFASLSSASTASINSHYVLALVSVFIPFAYTSCYSVYWIFSRRCCGRTLLNRVRARWRGYSSIEDFLPG